MAVKFGVGDIVHLNSGSPDLTVIEVDGQTVTVAWHDGVNAQGAEFPEQCLLLVKPFIVEVKANKSGHWHD